MACCVRFPSRLVSRAALLVGLLAFSAVANGQDLGNDPAALAKKMKAQQQELERQRKDIDALRTELHALLAQSHQSGPARSQSRQARSLSPARQSAPPRTLAGRNEEPPVIALASPPAPAGDLEPVDKEMQALRGEMLESVRAGQMQTADNSQLPSQPVGQQPQEPKKLPDAAALPEDANLLTPPGSFVFTPSVEYTRSSANALVFRGVEIVPGLQLGLINASNVSQDIATVTADVRVGLFDRLEFEGRIPWLARGDNETELAQQVVAQTPAATITTNLNGNGLGDIEGSLRYQLNGDVQQDDPVYIVSLRLKSNTGLSPYDVKFDSSGISSTLPTGTGFWAAGPGFLVLVPSDPAVLFVNGAYLHSFGYDINKTIGSTFVGNVTPGDSIELGLGFGLAVNSKFSFSLGYNHTAILPTTQILGDTKQVSTTLQAGQLSLGASYALNPNVVINTQFLFGVTSDAPNLDVTFRVPMNL